MVAGLLRRQARSHIEGGHDRRRVDGRSQRLHPGGQGREDGVAETLTLVHLDRTRRRIRLIADSGETFLLDLARAQHLVEGDGLELDGGGYLRVRAAPEPVLQIEAADRASLLR